MVIAFDERLIGMIGLPSEPPRYTSNRVIAFSGRDANLKQSRMKDHTKATASSREKACCKR